MAKIVEKSVTLSRALKEKNRWAGKLAQLREQISLNNSHEVDVPQDINVLKALEELKSEIAWLKSLSTKEGTYKTRSYGEVQTETYTATVKGGERLKMMEDLQQKWQRSSATCVGRQCCHRLTKWRIFDTDIETAHQDLKGKYLTLSP